MNSTPKTALALFSRPSKFTTPANKFAPLARCDNLNEKHAGEIFRRTFGHSARCCLAKQKKKSELLFQVKFTRFMSSLNELSPKILLRIFTYFDLNDLVSARRVNKKFRAVADDGRLYRCVSFNRSHRLDDIITSLSRHRQHIETCNLEDIADSNTVLRYVSQCPNLRKLRLRECDGERGITEAVLRKLFSTTKITQLALKNCELEELPKLNNLKHLTHLSIVDNTSYQQRSLQYAEKLLPLIKRSCGTLTSLRLSVDPMTSDEKNKLFKYVEKCCKLKIFHFQYPHVDEISEQNFRKLFNLHNLVSLSVVVSLEADMELYQEFMKQPWVNKLRKLELGGEICRLLPQVVKRCPDLEVLRLTCVSQPFLRVSSEELLQMLTSCKKLEEIELKSVAVQNLRRAVLQLPHNLPKLRHIAIETTEIDNPNSSASTPLQIEFDLVPNFALETQIFNHSAMYILFKSDELLRFLTS